MMNRFAWPDITRFSTSLGCPRNLTTPSGSRDVLKAFKPVAISFIVAPSLISQTAGMLHQT
jgi:hypothetical protein